MKEQTTRTPPKLRVLSAFLAVAMLLNLAAPLALADSVKCTVAGVELTGDVDSVPTETKIAGQVSYLNNTLTFHGDVTLTTVGVADLGTIPLIKAISEKNLRLVANGKVTGKAKGNGIEGAEEIDGGEYDLTYADWGAYSDTKPKGILGRDAGTTITAGTKITLKDFHTGIGGGSVQIKGTVNITGATFEGATYGIANSTTMNPGSELEIHADRYIMKDCLLTYNGGHLLMNVAENGDGNNIVQGRLSIGNVSRFWYRTDENGAYTEITVNENFENFTVAIGQNQDYLELTDVDPDQPESESYDLWVAGKQVTETNQDDVLDNGTVSYDPKTHTLTLRDADLDCWGTGETPIRSGLPQLTITGIGGAVLGRTNSITAENGDILFDDGDISLVRGTISANNLTFRNGSWIRMTEWDDTAAGIVANGKLDIDGSKVVIENEEKPCAIWAKGGDLTVSNGSTVQLQVQSTALKGSGKLCVMDGQWYRTSKDGRYEKGTGTPAAFPDSAYFEVVNKNLNLDWYHVWVAGTQVNSENKGNIAPDIVQGGTISYDSENDILQISGPVTLGSPTEPINKTLLEGDSYSKTTKLTADQTVEGWVTGAWHDGISSMDEIVAGHYILHAVDPDGNEGIVGQRNTKINSGVTVELHNFKKGIWFDPVTIYGDVFIYDGEIGLDGFDHTLMPGATLEIHAKKFLGMTGTSKMRYQGGHLTMNAADSTTEDRGLAALNAEVDQFWYRTGPEAAFVETTAEAFNSNKPLDAVYLELTDEEPSMDGYFIEGDYTYEITADGNVRILAYEGSEADVVVPATLGGRDVTEIGNSATPVFNAIAAIRSITFPDTLKEMSGLPLFYECENLETITIPASVTGMNFNSVANCFIFNCPNLKTIIFKGTRAQWEAIEKEDVNLDGITVRCSDGNVDPVQPDPDQPEQPDPGDPDDKDVFLQFEDCSVDVEKPDGTTLHFDALTGVIQSQRLPKGAKVTITLDEKAIPEGMKFSCWVFDDPRPEDLMEDGTTATFTMQEDIGVLAKFSTLEEEDSSADFGTIAAATAVVGVVGATAYLVGTEVALNQLLPAGTSVPQDRAQLALLLWNTAGRPEPAALPAFADVTDPDTAKAAQWCMEAGFFQPHEDGNFKPGKHVSRWKVLRTYQRIVK